MLAKQVSSLLAVADRPDDETLQPQSITSFRCRYIGMELAWLLQVEHDDLQMRGACTVTPPLVSQQRLVQEYMKNPPPPEWDGVEHLKSKSHSAKTPTSPHIPSASRKLACKSASFVSVYHSLDERDELIVLPASANATAASDHGCCPFCCSSFCPRSGPADGSHRGYCHRF